MYSSTRVRSSGWSSFGNRSGSLEPHLRRVAHHVFNSRADVDGRRRRDRLVHVDGHRQLLDELAVALLGFSLGLEQTRVLDRSCRLLRQPHEEVQIGAREGTAGAEAPDGHHPDHAVAREQRRHHEPLLRLLVRTRNRAGARILVDVVDDLGFAPGGETSDDPLADDDAIRLDLVGISTLRHSRPESLALRLREVDGARVGLEQVPGPFGNALEHRFDVDGGR
jgi:hypothetical protein